jgi:hypothetical protein
MTGGQMPPREPGPDEVDALLDPGTAITPWQRRILDAVIDGQVGRFADAIALSEARSRGYGKATAVRLAAEYAAVAGEHIHVGGRDATWCVTRQPVGYLWARVPKPEPADPTTLAIYDEVWP